MQFRLWLESQANRKVLVYKAGNISPGHIIHFGTLEAAKKAATGRMIVGGYLSLLNPIEMLDSGWAHDASPHKIIEDIFAISGNWEKLKIDGWNKESVINFFRQEEAKSVPEALNLIRQFLLKRGFDSIFYYNKNEDPGSISYMALKPEVQFQPI